MTDLDRQLDYWNTEGSRKSFAHPLNLGRVSQWLSPENRILDFGCGYGRSLGELFNSGYRDLIGFDFSPAMIAAARARFPGITFQELQSSTIPLPDASADGALLFSVLTCVPTDDGQRAILAELRRVLRPGGLLYISDLWLQSDERNLSRYARDEAKYGTYGVFDLPEGVTVRHHDPKWIESLTSDFEPVALDNIEVVTMNGNPANAFQWFGLKPAKTENEYLPLRTFLPSRSFRPMSNRHKQDASPKSGKIYERMESHRTRQAHAVRFDVN